MNNDEQFGGFFEASRDLIHISYELERKAKAFATIGNATMAEELEGMAEGVRLSMEAMRRAFVAEQNSHLLSSQTHMGAMLATIVPFAEKEAS